jgi:hypothetical protein
VVEAVAAVAVVAVVAPSHVLLSRLRMMGPVPLIRFCPEGTVGSP